MAIEHEESLGCWCKPVVRQSCPECEVDDDTGTDCWRCLGEGLVPVFDADADVIVVHNVNVR